MIRFVFLILILLIFLIIQCHKTPTDIDREYIVRNQDNWPAWSPDGQTIAYTHFDSDLQISDSLGKYQIWLINPDGGNGRYLTPGRNPAWSPDNQWLAYNVGSSSIIGRIKIDGSGFQQLTTNDDGDHGSYFPDWSPDGNRILFAIHAGPLSGVWVMNSDSSNKAKVVGWVSDPSWFPDGERFAAWKYTGSYFQICIYDTTGLQIDTVVSFSDDYCMSIRSPKVSPDESKVLFTMGTIPTQRAIVYSVNMDGSNLKALTPEGGEYACWSPDGQYISYAHSRRLYTENIFEHKIWIMNSDGTGKHQITFD